jgi:protein TonB
MKPKKSFKADLERRKPLFFKIGLVLALAGSLYAFEWKQTEGEVKTSIQDDWKTSEDISNVIPTKSEPIKKIELIRPTNLFVLVDNSVKVETPFEIEVPEGFIGEYKPIDETPEVSTVDVTDTVKVIVDFNAEYPGGFDELNQFFANNITYPLEERQIGLEGVLYVNFVIEKNGSVSNVSIAHSLSYNCDNEAIRVISMMPKWSPAKDHGKPARQKFTMPFQFKLK